MRTGTFAHDRHRMVQRQLVRRGIRDDQVLAAMGTVPRERFVDESAAGRAYEDTPLPIGQGQTISQPYIVAAMLQAVALSAGDRMLEVGAGSGYAAAVAGRIAGEVVAVERHVGLAAAARRRLRDLHSDNVEIRIGDGTLGVPERAPFDAIVVSAGGPVVPPALKDQLTVGGRLVIPVGPADRQVLVRVTRRGADDFTEESLGEVMFVPLIGRQGFRDSTWTSGP
ncbi:protein-L-isoaspartate(D-aspartate) O-methyltransferase [Nakamurella leprariae]|uniref:Protein-L-isoaspartate O-methyltransferase n=1 Tax=Nakamurella leprariae TaxID=2803911 RepID=A0A938Y5J6_9ACTN|nr:protein-L-isoaspartate(D-aspartate) O-methyltransferase [Nakamurella leprariae]MBM9466441.1 protein-L-isoaspartate(D-aspartate) O-methyltransferase [Nakamurella leprariae]